jgi:menaquinone-dependent protoporphyrinogen oxidase
MKTLITYASDSGFSKKIAEKIGDNLGENVFLVNLKEQPYPQLNEFQRIIIGGSVHKGKMQEKVKEFIFSKLNELIDKEIGLFICCREEHETARLQLREVYPEELLFAAKSTAVFNSCFEFEGRNFFERLVGRKISRIKNTTPKIDFETIHLFSRRMDRVFNPFLYLA